MSVDEQNLSSSQLVTSNRAVNRRQAAASIMASLAVFSAPGSAHSQAAGERASGDDYAGAVWWSELVTADPERASQFYSGVIGWTPKIVSLAEPTRSPMPGEKEYIVFTATEHEAAGAVRIQDTEAPPDRPMWITYVQVANVDAAAAKAVELGGKLLQGPFAVPNVGRLAVVEDLEGLRIGLVTPIR